VNLARKSKLKEMIMLKEAVEHIRTAAASTFPQVRVNTEDLKEVVAHLDRLETAARKPVPDETTFPIPSHTQYLNMSPDMQRSVAEELDLIDGTDNLELTAIQQAQVWWLRAHERHIGNEMITRIVALSGHPTSTLKAPAPAAN
jgi:hypothetical protein